MTHAPTAFAAAPRTANTATTATTAFDAQAYRRALGTFPTGVAIITTRDAQREPVGLTCNSFSSVSLAPPLVLWSLRKASKSIEVFRQTRCFAINVLAEDQDHLSARFATSSITDKFEGVAWQDGHDAQPLISDCVARFECHTVAQHEAGDHIVFIGQVDRFQVLREEDPLVFYKGAYMMLTRSLRELSGQQRISPQALADARALVYSALLRLACEQATPGDLDAIDAHLQDMDRLVQAGDMEGRMTAALQFFELLSAAAHNEVMALIARSLNTLLRHTVKAQAASRQAAGVYVPALDALRWDILAGLRRRDPEAVLRAMAGYLERATPV